MTPLLSAERLRKTYPLPNGRRLLAVDGVDLALARGETLAVVGESGCGKSTLGRLLLGLEPPDAGPSAVTGAGPGAGPGAGVVRLDGTDAATLRGRALRSMRRRVQVVFQDPYASLDPRQRIRDVLTRPMRLHGIATGAAARARAAALLERVGLSPAQLDRLPHEFSGGQRQRISIARALSVEPEAIVCDEPVSALDVSVQAQVINLLQDLQRETGVALLFISHNLAVVRHLAHRVAVMYAGRVVESAPAAALFARPLHPYTRALLAAAPRIDRGPRAPEAVGGDPPDPAAPPPGCRFAPRCPHVQPACTQGEHPALRPLAPEHLSACLFAEALPDTAQDLAASAGPAAARIALYRRARDGAA